MTVGLTALLLLAAALFGIGLYCALSQRDAVRALMGLELMTNAVIVNLVAFSRFITPSSLTGQVFAVFVVVAAAAEVGLGLALVLALRRGRDTVELDGVGKTEG